jgi:hypothetical protein
MRETRVLVLVLPVVLRTAESVWAIIVSESWKERDMIHVYSSEFTLQNYPFTKFEQFSETEWDFNVSERSERN